MNTINKIFFLIIVILFIQCKKNTTIPENQNVSNFDYEKIERNNDLKFINNSFGGETKLIQDYNKGFGHYAKKINGEISPYKIGVWKEFYQNGTIKSEGKYLIGRYAQCCLSGHCLRFYNYKIGKWNYYFPNGNLKMSGDYSIKKLWIDTNCGGDYIKYGILDKDSKFYNRNGSQIEKNINIIKLEFEKEYTYSHPGMYLIPSKEIDTIISIGFDN